MIHTATALDLAADRFFHLTASGISAQDLCFVFPSRRACTFFRQLLADRSPHKPIFAPSICTIADFVSDLSSLQKADRIGLIFDLYRIYSEVYGADAEPFDRFVYWGELMIADFDEIDKYLADAPRVLSNSYDLNEMKRDLSYLNDEQCQTICDFWREFEARSRATKSDQESITHNFLTFYKQLAAVYTRFRQALRLKGIGYEGMIYRDAAEQPAYEIDESRQYTFVGIFALTPAERKFLHKIGRKPLQATFIWDYSGVPRTAHGLDTESEIYKILQTNQAEFGGESIGQIYDSRPTVDIIKCGGGIAQTRAVRDILLEADADYPDLNPIDKVIVPADESLLMPLLSAVPHEQAINITMGYPLQQTHIAALFERWIDVVLALHNRNTDLQYAGRCAADRLTGLLSLQILIEADETLHALSLSIREQRTFFLSWQMIAPMIPTEASPLPHLLFAPLDLSIPLSPGLSLLDRMLQVIDLISQALYRRRDEPEDEIPAVPNLSIEYLMAYRAIIERLRSLLIATDYIIELETTAYLVRSLIRTATIPLEGEPLIGLQIMGILETRVLSFKHVLILSASDGILPKGNTMSTLIPFTIRRGYGLPTGQEDELTMAYHFYHLANNAQHLSMIYDTRTDTPGGSGEESRYIRQMHYLYGYDLRRRTLSMEAHLPPTADIVVPKSPPILQSLAEYLSDTTHGEEGGSPPKALSPSLINLYISCPLKFYYTAIKGLRQSSDVGKITEANEFGDLLHQVMQLIYDRNAAERHTSTIQASWYESLLSTAHLAPQIETLIEAQYRRYFSLKKTDPLDTQAELTITQLKGYVRTLLMYDKDLTPFSYIGSEVRLWGSIPIRLRGQYWQERYPQTEVNLRLKGTIDRIDIRDGSIRVIDYKTGSVPLKKESPELNAIDFDQIFANELHPNKRTGAPYKEAIQTLIYAELLKQQHDPKLRGYPIQPIVYALRPMARWGDRFTGVFSIKSSTLEKASSAEIIHYEQRMADTEEALPLSVQFARGLSACLEEIFDADSPFVQAPTGSMQCRYCPFVSICGR